MLEDQIVPAHNPNPIDSNINNSKDAVQETLEPSDTPATYGDLYVLGKLWIKVLEIGLLGTKWCLPAIVPVVKAANPPPPPKKPPKMKYKDLPLYTTPHHDYKDFEEDKIKCPKAKARLVHEYLLPRVRSCRQNLQQNYCDFNSEVASMKKSACCAFREKKNNFKKVFRDPDKLLLRRILVALGGIGGYYMVGGRNTSPRIMGAGVGLLTAGALCFPKETDETFRNLSYTVGKLALTMYNRYCNKGFAMRERLPCQSDYPPPLPSRKENVCPVKK